MAGPQRAIGLVAGLTDGLEAQGVSYCHWKSNVAIARSESGENDLDLLVDRRHATAFRRVLASEGFTRVERREKPLPPGKEDYFGFDRESGRLVHVDAHYQLVLGHDRTKNYRLPLEVPFLASATRQGLFRLPAPELEYIVLLVRMGLKYAIWDEVLWQGLRRRDVRPKPSEQQELAHLATRIDPDRIAEYVEAHAPWLDAGLLEGCASVARGDASLAQRLRVGRKLHRRLEVHARRAELVDGPLRMTRRVTVTLRRRTRTAPGFRLANGGAFVAVIGGDGSGKSTAVGELAAWLGDELDVRRIHLGKPRWSLTTWAVRGWFKTGRLLGALMRRGDPVAPGVEAGDGSGPTLREMAWLTCTARDRYLTYRRARRFANEGGIVISDRFPHPALQSMDVPLIASLTVHGSPNLVARSLIAVERRFHARIEPPDLIALLLVDPDTAVRRKTDEPADYVRRRAEEIVRVDWDGEAVSVVDGRRAKEDVATDLKSLIWDSLA